MAYYFGSVSTDNVSTLFSSLSTSSSSSLTSVLSDYSSIKNGSYGKLLKAYYAKTDSSSSSDSTSSSKTSTSNSTSSDTAARLTMIKSSSSSLASSSTALASKSSDSVFNKTTTTDSEGNSVTDYDTDKIYNAVSGFVKDYNSTVTASDDSNTSSIKTALSNIESATKSNSKSLEKIGITINDDNTLSIDEDTFKNSDMDSVKSLFSGSGSYGASIATKATSMNSSAVYEATKTSTYTSTGSYSASTSVGDLLDSLS